MDGISNKKKKVSLLFELSYKARGSWFYKLVTTQAFAAQQSLSGFKITLHVFAHLQYDDTDRRRALRAFVEQDNAT